MKSVQNSLDSSKSSAASAQDLGNKAIKNVAQGIQNTSWMFDKFSSLLDELAAAFDDVAPIASGKSATESTREFDANEVDDDQSSSVDAGVEVSTEQQAVLYQLSSVAAGEAKQKHVCSKESQKNSKAQEEGSDEDSSEEFPAIEEVSSEVSSAGVPVQGTKDTVQNFANGNSQDEASLPQDEESVDENMLMAELPEEGVSDSGSPEARVAAKDSKVLGVNQENSDKASEDESLKIIGKGLDIYQQQSATSAQGEEEDASGLQGDLAVAAQKPRNSEDLTGLPIQDKFQNKILNGEGSQPSAQSLTQQHASAQSFQSAVKSAQSAVSQTVESVREMLKELGAVSSASSLAKSLGQANASLAAQVKVERSDIASGKNVPPLTRSQILRTLERVESTLKEIVKSKDGKSISLRLDPPSLGSLKIDISYREGNLHARIVPESSQVALALRDRAHELQTILRRVGIDAMQVSVTIASPSSAGQEMPSHGGNYFLNEQAGEQGERSQGGEHSSSGSDSAPEGKRKDVLNQGGDKNLDHWVA